MPGVSRSLGVGVLLACLYLTSSCKPLSPTDRCPPLPTSFKESDLIGTWVAEYGGGDTATLILREDGSYKQIYDDPRSGDHFESDWKKWRVEYRISGFLRLHMESMRWCSDISSYCKRVGGGIGDDVAIDYCEGEGIKMPDAVILVVTGVTNNTAPYAPRGIWLRQMRLSGSDWSYSFALQR